MVGEKEDPNSTPRHYEYSLSTALANAVESVDEGGADNERLIKTPEWFNAPHNRFADVTDAIRESCRATTVEEAETYAVNLGVQSADYGSHLMIGNMMNEVMTQLHECGLPVFEHIFVRPEFFAEYGKDRYDIIAKAEDRVVKINPQAKVFTDPAESAKDLYYADFWSTPHPLHALYHEAGHLFFSHEEQPKRLLPRQVTVASAVSRYAQMNGEEFVSEVFAGLMCGVKYDKDILDLYSRLGGKKP